MQIGHAERIHRFGLIETGTRAFIHPTSVCWQFQEKMRLKGGFRVVDMVAGNPCSGLGDAGMAQQVEIA
ncbi:MAG TPA: hypothetical protein VFG19_08810 [Geobacteraceae bacterium]|nr:hypothetical protein [Geobacteraceae bacterium]